MDNLTHSLAGFASVEVLNTWKPQTRKTYLVAQLTALLANNFPDIDMVYTGIVPGKLGYLIHHRGHTHTIFLGALFSVLIGYLGVYLLKRRAGEVQKSEKHFLYGVALLGGLLHIFMDSWNTYGVHPFWPISSRWFYGDAVFIIEPVLWMSLLPVVMMSALPKGVRLLAGTVLAVVTGVIFYSGFILKPVEILLTLWAGAITAIAWKRSYRAAMLTGLMTSLLTVFSFASLSRYLEHKVAMRTSEALVIDDIILSALPANPFCWTLVIAFQDTATGEIGLRRGLLAPFSWVPHSSCPKLRGAGSTAPLKKFDDPSGLKVSWGGEYRIPGKTFKTWANDNCLMGSYLQFARAPFLVEEKDSLILGDLRFDWEESLSFAEIRVPKKTDQCPRWGVPWAPPRTDWLSRS